MMPIFVIMIKKVPKTKTSLEQLLKKAITNWKGYKFNETFL
jgi:hypothetical protein